MGADIGNSRLDPPIRRLAPLGSAVGGDLSFFNDPRYAPQLAGTRASAVIVREQDAGRLPAGCVALVVDDPYLGFAAAAGLVQARREPAVAATGVHPAAHVAPTAKLGRNVVVAAGAVISAGASVGEGVAIGPGCFVGERVVLGAGSRLVANVCVYADCQLGEQVLIHAGTVIGADGFGFAREGEGWRKIPQLGSVTIGDRVEIGANCTIDRGALEDTRVEDDCIIDNLVQVAHNVRIGAGSALAGCVGVAGSATIGRRCLIGGGAGVLGHLELADDVVVSPMSLVTRSIRQPGFYSGSFPLMDNSRWERAGAVLRQLPDMRARLRALEKLTRKPT